MFSVFRLLLVAVFVYVIFRIVQVTMRVLSSERRQRGAPDEDRAPLDIQEPERFEDIRDADFEDLPPGKRDGGTQKDAEGSTS